MAKAEVRTVIVPKPVELKRITLEMTVTEARTLALPVVNKLFGSSKSQYVSSRDLHAALEVKKDHSSWVAYVVKQYDLVEDTDYFVERLDKMDPANWPAIKANGGKVPAVFLFPPKLAARIATMTKTERGMQVWEYMYAVTDAAHDAVSYQGEGRVCGERRS